MTDIVQAMRQHDAQFTVVARSWPLQDGVEVLTVAPPYVGRLWRDWGFARAACSVLRRQAFDLVQAHERVACCDVFYCSDGLHREWLAQRRRIQGRWGRLGVALNPYHHYMMAAEEKLFRSPRLKAVICMSEMVKEEIRAHFGVAEETLHVIYNGIDEQAFHPALKPQYRAKVRAEHGIPADAPVFLFVGSGFDRKGVRPLLRAMAGLPESTHLLIVGKDKRMKHFVELARPLAPRVHFTGGQADVKPYYGAADALVFPTLYEPFGKVVLEAMACGLPVVSSLKAGASELIENGVNGFVCDALDIAGIMGAMTALTQPERRAQMGAAARRTAERITLQEMGTRLADFYQDVLGTAA